MSLYLVRHASAGMRSGWSGPDLQRPLDARGQAQADDIRAALASRPIGRIISSRAVRCVQTVEPLAAAVGMEVEPADEATEGASYDRAFELVVGLIGAEGDSVVCSHGDLIPAMLWKLREAGLADRFESQKCAKGSIWDLKVSDGRVTGAAYRSPSRLAAARSAPS